MAEVSTIPDYPRGLTFEKVWAGIQELKEEQRETARQMKETDRMMKETAREMKETDKRMKETDKRMKETDKQMKETDKQMRETDKRMGYLNNRFGELAEHLVAPGIVEKFQKMGFGVTRWSNNVKIFDPSGSVCQAEIDILLENGEVVVAVEVKAKPNIQDVKDHIKRMEKLRLRADRVKEKYKYVGAIAGAVMTENVRRFILSSGFYVIEQTGDTMKISVPEGFVPREW